MEFVPRCDSVTSRVSCWVQNGSPQHPPLSPLPHSIHLCLFLFLVQSAVSLFLFYLCLSPTKRDRSEYRLAASSCFVGNVRLSNFVALVLHTHTWFGIGSRAGAKPMAAEGSEGWEARVGSRGKERGISSWRGMLCESVGREGAQEMLKWVGTLGAALASPSRFCRPLYRN